MAIQDRKTKHYKMLLLLLLQPRFRLSDVSSGSVQLFVRRGCNSEFSCSMVSYGIEFVESAVLKMN